MTLLLFSAGLLLLLGGAEALVRGASRLAGAFGIPPLVIGLTVVAIGTSAPELAVSIGAALAGRADIALGNVVGSNIFNVLFILGLSALIAPLAVSLKIIRREVPIMIGVSLLVPIFGWDGSISRGEGLVLVAMGVAYTVFQVRDGRREAPRDSEGSSAPSAPSSSAWRSVGLILIGLTALVVGSDWLVEGAVALALALGMNELVIGLTVIAAGTSLPEVATSVMASLRGEREIAVGNVVGSNIFNILWVLGAASSLSGNGIHASPAALGFDIPVMVAAALACLPVFFTQAVIARWEGALFFGYYLAYTLLVILAATQSPNLPIFRIAILGFVVPLTVITLGILTHQAWRQRTP